MNKPRLLAQVRQALRVRHYSIRTEEAYVQWVRRFILFHDKRHPADMGEPEISAFLTHLAVDKHVSASIQNQALSALLFLYNGDHPDRDAVDTSGQGKGWRCRKGVALFTIDLCSWPLAKGHHASANAAVEVSCQCRCRDYGEESGRGQRRCS